MKVPSLIFCVSFIVPLVVLFTWIIRQDKRRAKWGLVILVILLAGVIFYMYRITKLIE